MSNEKKAPSIGVRAAEVVTGAGKRLTNAMLALVAAGVSILILAEYTRSELAKDGLLSGIDPEKQVTVMTGAFRKAGSGLLATFARPFALLLCIVNTRHPDMVQYRDRMSAMVVYHTAAVSALFRTLAVFAKATNDSILKDRTALSSVRNAIADTLKVALAASTAKTAVAPNASGLAASVLAAQQDAFPFPYVLEPSGDSIRLANLDELEESFATATVAAGNAKLAKATKAVKDARKARVDAFEARKAQAAIEAARVEKRNAIMTARALKAGIEAKNAKHAKDMLKAAQDRADARATKAAKADAGDIGTAPVTAAGKATLRKKNTAARETAAKMPANLMGMQPYDCADADAANVNRIDAILSDRSAGADI